MRAKSSKNNKSCFPLAAGVANSQPPYLPNSQPPENADLKQRRQNGISNLVYFNANVSPSSAYEQGGKKQKGNGDGGNSGKASPLTSDVTRGSERARPGYSNWAAPLQKQTQYSWCQRG
ncbi:hypothetical protein JTE90_026480 [Oedothorax gibbosus]|uniref:Uncharacterized protein n=1 Tax=Oedothorax gibbosus TaxID=931172 RepID=A0AAV6VP22_9ARAC|nr:hypothetical protein JTE90_026480 [Oedothorax gibbosus]